eukprot:1381439-Amorphochlora_amoeboformis.AAC.1
MHDLRERYQFRVLEVRVLTEMEMNLRGGDIDKYSRSCSLVVGLQDEMRKWRGGTYCETMARFAEYLDRNVLNIRQDFDI